MAYEKCFRPRIKAQREASGFELTKYVERCLRTLDQPVLVTRDVADDTDVVIVGDAEEEPDRFHCLECRRARQVSCRQDAGSNAPMDQIDKKLAVVFTANP